MVRRLQQRAGDFAHPIEFRQRDDRLVRGDLEHAVRAGVDNRLARAQVFHAQLLDNLRA